MHLIYLHIEKSAGTSQRELLWKNYGRDRVAWRGVDFSPKDRKGLLKNSDRPVLGGHFDYPDVRVLAGDLLITSVVREPVSRVVSLFNFWGWNAPDDKRESWRSWGLDPESMLATIRNSRRFRRAVSNTQCIRLSGCSRFENCLEVMRSGNFIVGTFDQLDLFNNRLAELLDWSRSELGRLNQAGVSDYQQQILAEPGLVDEIEKLIVEDRKLFNFVNELSLFENLPEQEALSAGLSPGRIPDRQTDRPGVSLRLVGDPPPDWIGEGCELTIRVENFGAELIPKGGEHPAVLGYHWLDTETGTVLEEGVRTALPRDVPPGARDETKMRIRPPRKADKDKSKLRISMLRVGKYWLTSRDPSHGVVVESEAG